MADKLQWIDKHLILLRYQSLKDCCLHEDYHIPSTAEPLLVGARFDEHSGVIGLRVDDTAHPIVDESLIPIETVERFLHKMLAANLLRESAELLCYALHKRVALWWVYKCVLAFRQEQECTAPPPEQLALGADDFALPKLSDLLAQPDIAKAKLASLKRKLKAQQAALSAKMTPEFNDFFSKTLDTGEMQYAKIHGIKPRAELAKTLASFKKPEPPSFKINADLEQAIATMRKEQAQQHAQMQALLQHLWPHSGHKLQSNANDSEPSAQARDDILEHVYNFICEPSEQYAKILLQDGNAHPESVEGMLAYAAFWSYGNLMPGGDQVVHTPPGLASKGLNMTIFKLCADPTGQLHLDERYALYVQQGLEIGYGHDSFVSALKNGVQPHIKQQQKSAVSSLEDNIFVSQRLRLE